MSDKMKFEDLIKEKLNNYNAPYDASAWEAIDKNLGELGTANKAGSTALTKTAIGLVALITIGVSGLFLFQNTEKETTTEPHIVITEAVENEAIQITPEVNDEFTNENTQVETASLSVVANKNDNAQSNSNADTKSLQLPEISISKNQLCQFEKLIFSTPYKCADCEYFWEFGDGNISQLQNPAHAYKTPGTYSVKLIVKHTKKNKVKEREWNDAITVYKKPEADFTWKSAENDCHNAGICFVNLYDSEVKYRWEFGDKSVSTEPHPTHTFTKKGHYNVKLVSENEHGCKDSVLKPLHVLKAYNLLAPTHLNVSTNDTWMPIALINNNFDFELSVLNPDGIEVFKTIDRTQNWNGIDSNGLKAKAGDIYLWIARIKNNDGSKTEYGGSIEITQ